MNTVGGSTTSGRNLARELCGLFLLFWGLLLLLSLITYDTRDPDLNHAVSGMVTVHNGAGLFGSYLGGLLNTLFGLASFIWPALFILFGFRQLFFQFTVAWWRWIGLTILAVCLMTAGSAWHLSFGDITEGGIIGGGLYHFAWKYLSPRGSLLALVFMLVIGFQLTIGLAWTTTFRSLLIGIAQFIVQVIASLRIPKALHAKDTSNAQENAQPIAKVKLEEKTQSTKRKRSNSAEPLTSTQENIQKDIAATILETPTKPSIIFYSGQAGTQHEEEAPEPLAQHHLDTGLSSQDSVSLTSHEGAVGGTPDQQVATTPVLKSESTLAQPLSALSGKASSTQSTSTTLFEDGLPWDNVSAEKSSDKEVAATAVDSISPMESSKSEPLLTMPTDARATSGIMQTKDEVDSSAPSAMMEASTSLGTTDVEIPEEHRPSTLRQAEGNYQVVDGTVDDQHTVESVDVAETTATSLIESGHANDSTSETKQTHDSPLTYDENDIASDMMDVPAWLQDEFFSDVEEQTAPEQQDEKNDAAMLSASQVSSRDSEQSVPTKNAVAQTSVESRTGGSSLSSAVPSQTSEQKKEPTEYALEVVLGADKDGIADLTEDEVGYGSSATVAPPKPKTRLPHISLLQDAPCDNQKVDVELLEEKGRSLTRCLADFGIQGELTRITPGPVVTMFEFKPAPGVKVSRIANLNDDLALALKAIAVRIQAPIPGSDTVGVEIPNEVRETVCFKELLGSETFIGASSLLTLAVGKDSAGRPSVADLGKMPHLLVAGATGAGKSVCLNSILLSFLYKARPEEVKLLLIDPKRIELAVYADLPHLVHPVVTDMSHAKNALDWAVHEMDNRYDGMARLGVRNIASYNQKLKELGKDRPADLVDLEFMPYLVIIIDELADLMLTAAKEVETSIVRLAQLARAAGIHMVLATQRPSVDVVTGLIKANFPCRISFQVTSKHDSRTILDTVGAEHLLGRGDMLFKPSGGRLQRLHGAFVSDDEVIRVVDFWKKQQAPSYKVDFAEWGNESTQDGFAVGGLGDTASDPVYIEAVNFVMSQGKASISLIQRRFRIGFNKAARYVEQMEQDGVIGPADGSKPRTVIQNKEH